MRIKIGKRLPPLRNVPLILLFLTVLSVSLFAADAFHEDFSAGIGDNGLPKNWKLKQWFGKTHQIEIASDQGKSAVRMISNDNSFGIYREFELTPKSAPILTWKWKATRLPEGGDVRDKSKDDQAAQIYVMFPKFPRMINTRLLGYIWDTTAPKEAKVTSQKSSNTRYIVLESGKEHLGEWIQESRNIYDDYKTLFDEDPPDIGGITLMIDSDDTHSSAESFFTDIRLEKKQ